MATSNIISLETLPSLQQDLSQYNAVEYKGELFSRDDSSPLTASADVIVTNGQKFIASGYSRITGVIEVNRNDPPSNPSVGDSYAVGPAPTGDWAPYPNSLQQWIRLGEWRRETARYGRKVRNLADRMEWWLNERGVWEIDGDEAATQRFTPVQGVSNSPPATDAQTETVVLVGTAGTGAFNGHNNAIATSPIGTTSWTFREATAIRRGEVVSVANGTLRRWDGTRWNEEGINSPLIQYRYPQVTTGNLTGLNTGILTLFSEAVPINAKILEIDLSNITLTVDMRINPPLDIVHNFAWKLQILYGAHTLLDHNGGIGGVIDGPQGIQRVRPQGSPNFPETFIRERISGLSGGTGQNLVIRIGYAFDTLRGRFVFNPDNPDPNFTFTNINTASGNAAIRYIDA